MIRKRTKSFKQHIEADLEILPLMNLFVVLIPMLLLSAVFLEIAVIKMQLPSDDTPANEEKRERLDLSIAISDGAWVVKGKRLTAQTIERSDEASEEQLRSLLASIKADHPQEEAVVIRSQETTRYDDIVQVMDASRESGLPNISLAGS